MKIEWCESTGSPGARVGQHSASLSPRTGNGSVHFSGSGKHVGLILDVVPVMVWVTKQEPGDEPFLAAKGKSLAGISRTISLAEMDVPSVWQ